MNWIKVTQKNGAIIALNKALIVSMTETSNGTKIKMVDGSQATVQAKVSNLMT